jgi:Domain of Unknown Function (DUF1080)
MGVQVQHSLFNRNLTRRTFVSAVATSSLVSGSDTGGDWIKLFDGHSLNGWRASEHKSSWTVSNGMLTANGPRSHLFYVGPVHGADFKNFDLEVELTTQPDCNSGVYFHTAYQESGFPEKGFEVQVNNTARGDAGYLERKKTGSLYGLRNMYKQLVPDQKPFRMAIAVRGKNVQIRLNGELLVDYVEPSPPIIPTGGEKYRFLDHGTFALQCHNDGSRVAYKSVRVRPLPGSLPAYSGPVPVVDDTYREIINVGRHNLPMVDFHVYLRPGLSLEQALRKSRNDGIQYGVTANASTLSNDAAIKQWIEPIAGRPVFLALSTENADWMKSLSQGAVGQFDYVIANGKGASVDTLLKRLHGEPIDILSGLGAVPKERTKDLISALVENKVSLELNTVHRTPSHEFILQAKEAGCKFAFGTANANAAELRRCEYGLQAVEQCKLGWQDFFTPGGWWSKAVERRWSFVKL